MGLQYTRAKGVGKPTPARTRAHKQLDVPGVVGKEAYMADIDRRHMSYPKKEKTFLLGRGSQSEVYQMLWRPCVARPEDR